MAVPFILGAVAVASGIYGVYKGVSGAVDHNDAGNLNSDASSMVDAARKLVETRRRVTNDALVDYGARKLRAFNGAIADFIQTFGRLKNVEILPSTELDKLMLGDFSTHTFAALQQDYQALKDAGLGVGAGLGGGAALAFGAYNGTMMLATASTGTAISTLSGVAATNATLAWLGGGSLAAGGYGVAGGMMVLGGVVAGPALAIFGYIVGNKGEEALNKARSNLEQAKTIQADAKKTATQLDGISQVTALTNTTFSAVTARLRRSVNDLQAIIKAEGEDYNGFSSESREAVFRTVKFAQLIKAMIDTPILDQDGALVLSTEKRVKEIAEAIGA